jgi:glycerol-1-phosphatase
MDEDLRPADELLFGRFGVDGVLCDLDGVVYRGNTPVPGAPEAIARLRDAGVKFLFCTNNSHFTVPQYVEKLERMGIAADADDVLTSAIVTADVLSARGFGQRTALVVGGDGVREALTAVGIDVTADNSADVVVVGWDPAFGYDQMRAAAQAVRAGAAFVATNADATFPAAEGLWPGAGSILASIETASGRRAEVMGKPHEPMMEAAAQQLSGSTRVAVVGDRADSDLAGGRTRGWTTVLVLTGVTRAEDVSSIEPRPDYVVEDLASLRTKGRDQ